MSAIRDSNTTLTLTYSTAAEIKFVWETRLCFLVDMDLSYGLQCWDALPHTPRGPSGWILDAILPINSCTLLITVCIYVYKALVIYLYAEKGYGGGYALRWKRVRRTDYFEVCFIVTNCRLAQVMSRKNWKFFTVCLGH